MSGVVPSLCPAGEEILFEIQDAEIFRIPDPKTRLDALQHYFFPRLSRVVTLLLERVREVYGIDPFDETTLCHRPAHRKDAREVKDFEEVFVGICGKREENGLAVFHPDGTPFKYPPCELLVAVEPAGALCVSFRPFIYQVDEVYRRKMIRAVRLVWPHLSPALTQARIAPSYYDATILESLRYSWVTWNSSPLPFPFGSHGWMSELVLPFVVLYPLLDCGLRLARGESPRLGMLVARLRKGMEQWVEQGMAPLTQAPEEMAQEEELTLPAMESYHSLRPRRWWQVLSRDRYTCRLCGRSAEKHGVVLHVDHIVPRSKGGTDEMDNLRTLCMKCNLGRSNLEEVGCEGSFGS